VSATPATLVTMKLRGSTKAPDDRVGDRVRLDPVLAVCNLSLELDQPHLQLIHDACLSAKTIGAVRAVLHKVWTLLFLWAYRVYLP